MGERGETSKADAQCESSFADGNNTNQSEDDSADCCTDISEGDADSRANSESDLRDTKRAEGIFDNHNHNLTKQRNNDGRGRRGNGGRRTTHGPDAPHARQGIHDTDFSFPDTAFHSKNTMDAQRQIVACVDSCSLMDGQGEPTRALFWR